MFYLVDNGWEDKDGANGGSQIEDASHCEPSKMAIVCWSDAVDDDRGLLQSKIV